MRFVKTQPAQPKAFLAAMLAALAAASPAHAATECTVQIKRIFAGDGQIWLIFASGGAASLSQSDPDREATLAMAMTAQVAGRSATVRYAADGVACNVGDRSDLVGFWLN